MKALSLENLDQALSELDELQPPELRIKWREVMGSAPPRTMRTWFLRAAIAYRLQEQTLGGLKPATQRHLQRLALNLRKPQDGTSALFAVKMPTRVATPHRRLSPGTRLMREWNGTTQLVEVSEDGFIWRAKSYRTLSAVAVAITGTKWSGPKFFGLDRHSPGVVGIQAADADPCMLSTNRPAKLTANLNYDLTSGLEVAL